MNKICFKDIENTDVTRRDVLSIIDIFGTKSKFIYNDDF